MCHGMANKVIPFPRQAQRFNQGVLATVRRTVVLRAGELEITMEITAEARALRKGSDATQAHTQSKTLPIQQPTAREGSDDAFAPSDRRTQMEELSFASHRITPSRLA